MATAQRDLEEPLQHEIDPGLQQELLEHPGKWVAITRTRLVAIADTATQALEQARADGVQNPMLYRVLPKDENAAYFF